MRNLGLVVILLLAACGGGGPGEVAAQDGGDGAIGPAPTASDVTGAWTFSMQPDSRPALSADKVPAPCNGSLMLTEVAGVVEGTWSCDDGRTGAVQGVRDGPLSFGLRIYVPGPSTGGAGDTWLNTDATINNAGDTITGRLFSATRAP